MTRYLRSGHLGFALLAGLAAGTPAIALDPPQHDKQTQTKQESKSEKKAEPAKRDTPPKEDTSPKENDERIDRRNSRMKERNHQIDGLLNKPKK